MMRLSSPGGPEQIEIVLSSLHNNDTTGNLAALVTFSDTPDYHAYLAAPRIQMNAWHEDNACHVANAEATEPLALFLAQRHGFQPVTYGHMETPCDNEPAFQALIAGLTKLTATWGFMLVPGKPDWLHETEPDVEADAAQ